MKTPKIVPLQDRVLLMDISEEKSKTKSGIILPDSHNKGDGMKRAKVIAVGSGRYDDGKLVPMNLKVGDIVIYSWAEKIKIEDVEYSLVREGDILAKLN